MEKLQRGEGVCLVCGKDLIYYSKTKIMTCLLCGDTYDSNASCVEGHYVCDSCHSEGGVNAGLLHCLQRQSKNPLQLMMELMDMPEVYMHGPEHHVLVGAALLTAFHNAGGKLDLPLALQEMKKRGGKYPGGSCGLWGACGAAVSTGMAYSIIRGTTPLSTDDWSPTNRITANALQAMADIGGPRCCKRNSFIALLNAIPFIEKEIGVRMEKPERVICHYLKENKECKGPACPYFPKRP